MKTLLSIVLINLTLVSCESKSALKQDSLHRDVSSTKFCSHTVNASSNFSPLIIEHVSDERPTSGITLIKFEGKQYLIVSRNESVAIIEHVPVK